MTPEERLQLIESIKAAVGDAQIVKGIISRLNEIEQRVAERGSALAVYSGAGLDPFVGEAFTGRIKALREGSLNTGRIPLAGVGLKDIKSLISGPAGDSPSTTYPTPAQRGPTVPPTQRPLMLLDVLPSISVTSNRHEHVRLSRVNNAGVQQGEGVAKDETNILTELVESRIATVAHHTTASKQVLADNSQLGGVLRRLLGLDTLDKFERLLLNGDGETDEILGLIPQSVIIEPEANRAADRISEASAGMWSDGYFASALVMHPLDWHKIRTERAEEGDGQYVAGGWARPAAPTVWDLPLVQTPSIALGQALLIDTSRVEVLDRQEVTVLVSTEHADNFIKNLMTILAELRGGIAVYDTMALGLVSLTGNSPG